MNVLHLINSLGAGGAERSLAEMLPALRERGVDSTVVCLVHRDEGVHEQVVSSGFEVHLLEGRGWIARVRALRRIIRTRRPDIVHTTLFEADIIGRLAAAGLDSAVVTSIVNTSYDRGARPDPNVPAWKLEGVRQLDSWTARHLTHQHHAITAAVRDSAISALKVDPKRVSVIMRGRNVHRLGMPSPERRADARRELGIPTDAEVIVAVGRQEHQKGLTDLLSAMRIIGESRPRTLLLHAGREGHASTEIASMLTDPALRDRVMMLGHREDVPRVLAAGDVFAFPSLYEGLGGVTIEAMALGLPIIASSLPALREVVEEGNNADLVAPADSVALARALGELLDDSARRERYGQRSRQIFEDQFTLDRSIDAMLDLYEGVRRRGPRIGQRKADEAGHA